MQLKMEKQEDEKELMLIQEAVERNVEALLGSMTESAFENKNEAHFKEEIMRLTKELKEANKELAELKSYCKYMGEHKRKEREKEGRRSQRK